MRGLFVFGFVALVALVAACAQSTSFDDDAGDMPVDSGVKEAGSGCPGSTTKCGTACVDTTKDLNNCGACGKKCAGTSQYCAASKCTDNCSAPLKLCGQFCIDTQTDHDNCGSCGKPCAVDQECKGGMCLKKCPLGLTVCDMSCVDTTSDPNYCGDCNTQCAMNEHCTGSTCCPGSMITCNGTCTDTNGDSNNCGACGFACGGNTPYCTNGVCGILSHGIKQLAFDYTSSGGCGDFSVWRTQNFGMMTFDACEKLANEYGAQYVGAPTLYGYTAPYAASVRWVGEKDATTGYVSANSWNIVTPQAKTTPSNCVLGYANGTTHGVTQFSQTMTSANGKSYFVKDFGSISELTCYSNARDAGARPMNPQMFGLNFGATHMIENHSCHGSCEYNGSSYTSDGSASHTYRCFLGYN